MILRGVHCLVSSWSMMNMVAQFGLRLLYILRGGECESGGDTSKARENDRSTSSNERNNQSI